MNRDDLRHVVAIGRGGTLAAASRALNVGAATTAGRRTLAIEEALGRVRSTALVAVERDLLEGRCPR